MIKLIKKVVYELSRPMLVKNDFKDYDDYWEERGFHAPSLCRAKIISKYIEPGSSVLDIGCGDGTIMEYLEKNNSPREVVGIDISSRAVSYIKGRGMNAYQVDVMSENFPTFLFGRKFDYIIITEVLEHIQDPEKVILSIREHVERNVFISIPNSGFILHRIRLLFGKFPLVAIKKHVKEHIRFWTLQDFVFWSGYYGYVVDSVVVSDGSSIKLLAFLQKLFPSLFAQQILFKISKKIKTNVF